jgi:hypothetical protein
VRACVSIEMSIERIFQLIVRAAPVLCALANQLRFVVDFVHPPVLKVQLDTVICHIEHFNH